MTNIHPLRLSELTAQIGIAVSRAFEGQTAWVIADITDHKYYRDKGYHFFDLVEKEPGSNLILAKISATAWGRASQKISAFETLTGQKFTNDIQVLIRAEVQYHPVYGLKLNMLDIDPAFTLGVLEQQRRETLRRLLAECAEFIRYVDGKYITLNNLLTLNIVIQRIAVISSLNSAGYQDFMHTLENNAERFTFAVDTYLSAVQGEENAPEIHDRFLEIFRSGKHYDAVVLIRGGGAQTDFLIFDTYMLGRVVAKFPIPVITGIGHHMNETIVDLMAHTATKTPTQAAEFIIAHNRKFEEHVLQLQKNIVIQAQQMFGTAKHELALLLNRLISYPVSVISGKRSQLAYDQENIRRFSKRFLVNHKGYLGHFESMVRMMHPENIVKKGFAIIYHKGRIVNDASGIGKGAEISVAMQDALLTANVVQKKKRDGKETDL